MSKKILVVGDYHLSDDNIEETDCIHNEIVDYDADWVVQLGDYFDNKRPSPKLIYNASEWAKIYKDKFDQCLMLRGNHPMIEDDFSCVDFLWTVGWGIYDDYVDNDNIFFGHFMTNGSYEGYGEYSRDTKLSDLEKYDLVMLGHQHTFQKLTNKIYHIGSTRFVSFGELKNNPHQKFISIIENGVPKFIPLESPIPMVEVHSVAELRELPSRTKVRIVYNSYEQFKAELNEVEKAKGNFAKFKMKLNFEPKVEKVETKNTFAEIVETWLTSIKDPDVKVMLREGFNCVA